MVGIGLAGRKYGGSMNDFMTAGKQGTLLLVTGSYIGSHIGNGIVVGGAEYGAVYGIGECGSESARLYPHLLFSAVMSRRVYRGNCVTLSDMLEQRYGDKVTTILMAVLNGAANTAVMAGQIMAGKRLFEYIRGKPGAWSHYHNANCHYLLVHVRTLGRNDDRCNPEYGYIYHSDCHGYIYRKSGRLSAYGSGICRQKASRWFPSAWRHSS